MSALSRWRLRWRTLRAMAVLCVAQAAVTLLPFRYWRATVGRIAAAEDPAPAGDCTPADSGGAARRMAVHVERGAARLPFSTRCLPRAVALCWLLRGAGIAFVFKIAARPAASRHLRPGAGDDNLHAWVEAGGATVIGALPGPWLVVLILRG